jgi:putative heme-binding domain-containing protein
MGYPTFFKNFPEDMLQPLADYGGGSPCGALWIDEPGLQNGLYTVEWGRNAIMYHPLTREGAGWKAGQQEWMKIVRPTDMDVDASGRIYVSSWEGATFTYNGPYAGYVLRVVKKDKPAVQVPSLTKRTPDELTAAEELVQFVGSKSAVIRQAAQRELIRRIQANPSNLMGVRSDKVLDLMEDSARKGDMGAAYAAYWVFVIPGRGKVQGFGIPAENFKKLPPDWRLLEIRALSDPTLDGGSDDLFAVALKDEDPRIRAAAITAVRRKSRTALSRALLPLVADQDPIVSHLAIRALTELKASQVCLTALDSVTDAAEVPPATKATTTGTVTLPVALGAVRALYAIYEPGVVDGLIARLPNAVGDLHRAILKALCRLDNQDAPYLDPKEWWGTRPDTSGPVYKPVRWQESEKIEAALKKELDSGSEEQARWLLSDMYRTKVHFPGLVELMLAKAGADTAAKLNAVEGLFRPDDSLPLEGAQALESIAANENENPIQLAKALRFLQRGADHREVFAKAVAAFAPLTGRDLPHPALTAAVEDFTHDVKNTKWIGDYVRAAEESDGARRTLAQTVLINLATSNLVKGKEKERAVAAVEKAWAKPETAASLLGVIARTKAKSYADQVRAHLKDPNNAVAESALFAYQSLGLKDSSVPVEQIGAMKYEEIKAAVAAGGDPAQGKDIFLRAGCIACHTTTADEPAKGPIMSAVAKIYDRATLAESILKPNAKIAQGFESQWFKTTSGEQVEGFVTREGGDSLDVRNVAGQSITLAKTNIAERGKREQSMMPEGLLNAFTPAEFASLLAYLESLKAR